MADYRWFEHEHEPLPRRYPNERWIGGLAAWAPGADVFPFAKHDDGLAWIDAIRRSPPPPQPTLVPRVFVSHRQIDQDAALRIAWLVFDKESDHWLDVIDLDPVRNAQVRAIEARLGRALTPAEQAILTAAIIEMALVNCTDVIAVMTANTAGSQWVPYEYGRVKEPVPVSRHAACWHDHTTLLQSALPEYLFLGAINLDEAGMRRWCATVVNPAPRKRGGKAAGTWTAGATVPLPTG